MKKKIVKETKNILVQQNSGEMKCISNIPGMKGIVEVV